MYFDRLNVSKKHQDITNLSFNSDHLWLNKTNLVIILKKISGGFKMKKYICSVCGYVYDPEKGIPEEGIKPGTSYEDLPSDFACPVCGVGKEEFEPEA